MVVPPKTFVIEERDYDHPCHWKVVCYDYDTSVEIVHFDVWVEDVDSLTPELINTLFEQCETIAKARGYDYQVDADGQPSDLPDTNGPPDYETAFFRGQ